MLLSWMELFALDSDSMRVVRTLAERWMPVVVVISTISLIVMHRNYVAVSRCLPPALQRVGLWNFTSNQPVVGNDTVLFVSVVPEWAVQKWEKQEDSQNTATQNKTSRGGDGTVRIVGNSGFRVADENVTVLGTGSGPKVGPEHIIASYKFAFDREIVTMRQAVFEGHHFPIRNVTIKDSCVTSSGLMRELFRLFDVYDNVIINELAYTFRSRGYMERFSGGTKIEAWAWSAEQVETASPQERQSILATLVQKMFLLAKSIFGFVLTSAVTGFFIRVAVNGSAVLMFPLAIIASRYGSNRFSIGLLTRSFPWIGVHTEVLRRGNRPLFPLFRSHLIFMFMQSFAYLSCNLAWRFVLFRKSSPVGFEENIFSFFSIMELFNLLFVRSVDSTVVFPKLATACMVYFHFYVFSSLYPFHTLAFFSCGGTCIYVMAFCLNHYEEPALRADPALHTTPTATHPRGTYMPQLSPSWTLESAPLWTMFYPPDLPSTFPEEALRHISSEEYLMA
eukprot:TRINITY_DN17582_c0_g1_i2.p1 TRINITY_DN17582_c0_g1~~TRINITY_DN17582_c0_g1_i2.p1  ORF type:complete len:506 (+),score=68.42 TRINITY_DN17582_c0_g1_i2:20-1537(+)